MTLQPIYGQEKLKNEKTAYLLENGILMFSGFMSYS